MSDDPAPAIARHYSTEDREIEVLSTPYDSVTFQRGMGDSGRKIQIVDKECPRCSFEGMIRQHRVIPTDRDQASYWCLHPNCAHYHGDQFSYAMSTPKATTPAETDW